MPLVNALPTAAELTFSELGAELAARVWSEQLAWIKPVLGGDAREYRGQFSGKIGDVGTALVPKSRAAGCLVKAEYFLDAAVAVSSDDEDAAREITRGGQVQHDVVVELALDPVGEDFVTTVARRQVLKQGAEHEMMG